MFVWYLCVVCAQARRKGEGSGGGGGGVETIVQ